MAHSLSKWVRQKPDYDTGDYWFNGQMFVTTGVQENLSQVEVIEIIKDIRAYVEENQGIDYLQVYKNEETNEKLFFIDSITKEDLETGIQLSEHNYCTLIFDYEY